MPRAAKASICHIVEKTICREDFGPVPSGGKEWVGILRTGSFFDHAAGLPPESEAYSCAHALELLTLWVAYHKRWIAVNNLKWSHPSLGLRAADTMCRSKRNDALKNARTAPFGLGQSKVTVHTGSYWLWTRYVNAQCSLREIQTRTK